mmetsp:Transcript_13193/g.22762  ORF Transcript_13193/g.22762 Transcript_13193/m.22762 type:complete len:201 (-) Transcript_13193:151-753(-)
MRLQAPGITWIKEPFWTFLSGCRHLHELDVVDVGFGSFAPLKEIVPRLKVLSIGLLLPRNSTLASCIASWEDLRVSKLRISVSDTGVVDVAGIISKILAKGVSELYLDERALEEVGPVMGRISHVSVVLTNAASLELVQKYCRHATALRVVTSCPLEVGSFLQTLSTLENLHSLKVPIHWKEDVIVSLRSSFPQIEISRS